MKKIEKKYMFNQYLFTHDTERSSFTSTFSQFFQALITNLFKRNLKT